MNKTTDAAFHRTSWCYKNKVRVLPTAPALFNQNGNFETEEL